MSDDIWREDRLNREADAEFLIRFLINRIEERARSGRTRSYVLNVNASWGTGKTFFLERLKRQLERDQYPVAYVNAWADDHAADPLLSVMSAIDEAIQPLIVNDKVQAERWKKVKATAGVVAVSVAKGAIKHWTRKAVGEGADAIGDLFFGNDQNVDDSGQRKLADSIDADLNSVIDKYSDKLLSGFRQDRAMIDRFRSGLKEFIEKVETGGIKPPLFVLIDELDRCRPLYAIELLERVKHIFETDNVVFIIATDTEQLGHSVKAIYGSEFDAERYLMRFFDRRYEFEVPSADEYVGELCKRYELDESSNFSLPPKVSLTSYLAGCFSYYGLTLRDIDQCIDVIRTVETTWSEPKLPIQICLLAPIVVLYQQRKKYDVWGLLWKELSDLRGHTRGYGGDFVFNPLTVHSFIGGDAAQQFLTLSRVTLPSAISNTFSDIVNTDARTLDWVKSQYSQELDVLYSGGYPTGNEPRSITMLYPDFVRSAGRLVGNAFLMTER